VLAVGDLVAGAGNAVRHTISPIGTRILTGSYG
jgi:hypothetical protein